MTTAELEELRRTGEELRAVFADERRAISTLDAALLEIVAARKQQIAAHLEQLRSRLSTTDPLVRDLFAAIRVEAQATALLATTATQAVRELLGYRPANAYDRRARHETSRPGRVLGAY